MQDESASGDVSPFGPGCVRRRRRTFPLAWPDASAGLSRGLSVSATQVAGTVQRRHRGTHAACPSTKVTLTTRVCHRSVTAAPAGMCQPACD